MQLHRADRNHMELAGMDFLGCQSSCNHPQRDGDDDPAIQHRLFSQPTGGREPEFERDGGIRRARPAKHFKSRAGNRGGRPQKIRAAESAETSSLRIPVKNLKNGLTR